MILVAASQAEEPVVREFFELFKTPWQFFSSDKSKAAVLLCSTTELPTCSAKLVLLYGSREMSFDREKNISAVARESETQLVMAGQPMPIHGQFRCFKTSSSEGLQESDSGLSAACKVVSGNQIIIRIGYDLFEEIRFLLVKGQPARFAGSAALEQHIAFLRELILRHVGQLVEIPPAPQNHPMIACLTHDVDHVGIRNHLWNHTMAGFLYRATAGTAVETLRGRKTVKQLGQNWIAALSLPFVCSGLADDFWITFERYLKIEQNLASTFFIIPKKGEPGLDANGNRQFKRAAQYDATTLKADLQKVRAAGHEIGVHGIDAWRDASLGRDELNRISQLTGARELGVRMHWLYFDGESHEALENAGFSYDSTVGYNETVGFRAGTTQVYQPLTTTHLLELPMHVMDTALFYPDYLALSPAAATETVRQVLNQTLAHGGVITINWHDRSIAPERLWDGFYIDLLNDLKQCNAWFATAAQTVSWFRKRRQTTFEEIPASDGGIKIRVSTVADESTPGLRVRVHGSASGKFTDVPCSAGLEIPLAA